MWNIKKTNKNELKLIDTENRLVVARSQGVGEWEDVGQRVQTCSYKMNKFWGSNIQHGDYS